MITEEQSKVKRITKHKNKKPYLWIFHRYGKSLQKPQRDFPFQHISDGTVQHININAPIQHSL